MSKFNKSSISILVFFLWFWVVFAANNYFKEWYNWDANVAQNATESNPNDLFKLIWRLDLEDSRTNNYINNWYRWKITWTIISDLFWDFAIKNSFNLYYKEDYNSSYDCWTWETPLEIYNIEWSIESSFWWELSIMNWSYFCSNQYTNIKFNSNSLWDKDIWTIQWNLVDDFWKQEIYITWIANLKWDLEILDRGDQDINKVKVSVSSKTVIKKDINKNIFRLFKTHLDFVNNTSNIITDFNNVNVENYYLYNFEWENQILNFEWWDYINKWKSLQIWNNWAWKIWIEWIHTVIVQSWNIYINSNLYNENDNSLLLLIAKKWNNKGWNIYIDPDVTNIDAVLFADWSLISLEWNNIQSINDNSQKNNLRKQLLIYGSVVSSNNVWTDKIPYWADYYENSLYPGDIMSWNIYDLWNLRTFNLNYWEAWSNCTNQTKLAPIDWYWNYIEYSWAWKKKCYNTDNPDVDLRGSSKRNPLIIEYNSRIKFINPSILKK